MGQGRLEELREKGYRRVELGSDNTQGAGSSGSTIGPAGIGQELNADNQPGELLEVGEGPQEPVAQQGGPGGAQ
eukprot:7190797-Heterocapsa_arctica.AAC.1